MNSYDLVFLTNIPAFYKINLYNEIAKKKKIFVIFMSKKSLSRDEDFYKGAKNFNYIYLEEDIYEERKSIKNSLKLRKVLKKIEYSQLVIGGWDSFENWMACLSSPKRKNAVVVESSEFESTSKGVKGLLKKIFLSKISLGYASGQSQINLLKNIGYKGEVRKTKGVGIFNYNNRLEIEKKNILEVKKFLYVGRLSLEKNIEQLINVFNNFPNLELNIVGYGPLEKKLKQIANKNINFLGKIDNEKLNIYYQYNDVFVLPSKSEPWGLVVEEALYNGIPYILSNKVGIGLELIKNEKKLGLIYDVDSDESMKDIIKEILNIEEYIKMKNNIKQLNFDKIKDEQIAAYCY
ncbi:MAG: glycosyltransferase [Cetobacterium sp.]|uniref:glycosyltransferase n=1 Tax=Cetobacterium sp. TaxID=2071632 RepID=UPI003F3C0786